MQDPKTSRWLWDLRERARQKKRTEHYREIMRMQHENVDMLEKVDEEDDSAEVNHIMEKLTKLAYYQQMENYLSYGKWDLTEEAIERLKKDEEAKQRVRSKAFLWHRTSLSLSPMLPQLCPHQDRDSCGLLKRQGKKRLLFTRIYY